MGGLHRLGREEHILERDIRTLVRHDFACPQRLYGGQIVVGDGTPFVERHLEDIELGPRPTDAYTKDKAPPLGWSMLLVIWARWTGLR